MLAGCDNPFGPDIPIPDYAVSIGPDESWGFEDYWAQVERDTGRKGDFDRISWYLVPSGPWPHNDGSLIYGLWQKRGRRIYIAEGSQSDGRVVRHEMLHYLLDDPSHDHPLFETAGYRRLPTGSL